MSAIHEQPSLFAPRELAATRRETRTTARNAKKKLETLRAQLEAARLDLETQEYNLSVVEAHQQATHEGRIDANWWEGAMRFGIWHFEIETEYRMGNYPIKVVRWLRHLNFTLNAACHSIRQTIDELTPQVEALAQLIDTQEQ